MTIEKGRDILRQRNRPQSEVPPQIDYVAPVNPEESSQDAAQSQSQETENVPGQVLALSYESNA